MARGSNTLFADIFDIEVLPREKKGRSADLNDLRNECLIDRYFWYGAQRLSYSAILDNLSKEFFLSPHTIPYIIGDKRLQLRRLKEEKPTDAYFRKKWTHLQW